MIQETLVDGRLRAETIAYLINNTDLTKFSANNSYFTGNNPTILLKTAPTDSTYPNNKVPIPYGRKIALTTKNYMFSKPVNYTAEDKDYMAMLTSVFNINENQNKVNTAGEDLVVYGVAYKMFYFGTGNGTTPRYALIDGDEIIPIYSYDIEPEMVTAIRFYQIVNMADSSQTKTIIEVYYKLDMVKYIIDGTVINETTMMMESDKPHGFYDIPLVVYGDRYQLGVFDTVKKIIDGIDSITSTDLNEIEKFELAYLILKGQKLDPSDVDKIKETRIFELDDTATLEYLLKQIDNDFNGSILDFLVAQIHKQSGVPDFDSKEFAAESGVALLYKLMGFENLAASYEILFTRGEQRSIDIINSIMFNIPDYDRAEYLEANPGKHVDIAMTRNIPGDVKDNIETAKEMLEVGISMEKILDFVTVIDDTDAELKRIEKQKKDNIQRFNDSAVAIETKEVDEQDVVDDDQEG